MSRRTLVGTSRMSLALALELELERAQEQEQAKVMEFVLLVDLMDIPIQSYIGYSRSMGSLIRMATMKRILQCNRQ